MEEEFTIPKKRPFNKVFQFKITLLYTKPPVWRVIGILNILIPKMWFLITLGNVSLIAGENERIDKRGYFRYNLGIIMSIISQVQLKISLSEQLSDLLQSKAAKFGVPVTQFVKHLIIKEVENEVYPTFAASGWLEEKTQKAMKDIKKGTEVKNVHQFFKDL